MVSIHGLIMYSIWRPLRGPVECNPLGLLDGSTVAEERLAEVDVVRESYVGEAYYPLQDDRYRWYFIHGQTKEEVLIMKMYDSSETARAKCKRSSLHVSRIQHLPKSH